MARVLQAFLGMNRASFLAPLLAPLILLFGAPAHAQDAGVGRSDAAISPSRDAGSAVADVGTPDGGIVPAQPKSESMMESTPEDSPEDSPEEIYVTPPELLSLPIGPAAYPLPAPVPYDSELPFLPHGVYLQPRGAATLAGSVVIDRDRVRLEVVGAAPGSYLVRLIRAGGCPASPPSQEQITGEVDMRTRPTAVFADKGMVLGEIRVPGDGRGHFELAVGRRDLPKDAKSIAVLLEERPGTVNPSNADALGLVACSALELPNAG